MTWRYEGCVRLSFGQLWESLRKSVSGLFISPEALLTFLSSETLYIAMCITEISSGQVNDVIFR